MKLPDNSRRVFVAMGALALLMASLGARSTPLDPLHARFTLAMLGAVLAFSTRSALVLLAARAGGIAVDAGAPSKHRLLTRTLPSVVTGAAAGALFSLSPLAASARALPVAALLAGCAGIGAGVVFTRLDAGAPRAPRPSSRLSFILLDTALPSAVVAAGVGVVVGLMRLSGSEVVTAGEAARHVGGTVFLYAVFLGLGGFLKTYSEQSAGLVVVDKTTLSVPGPILSGGALGVLALLGGGLLFPDMRVTDLLWLKGAAGFFVGGLLSALGAVQGARAASLGLKRRPRR